MGMSKIKNQGSKQKGEREREFLSCEDSKMTKVSKRNRIKSVCFVKLSLNAWTCR